MLEQVVLRMHSFGDEVPATLQNHFAVVVKVNTDVRAIDLFLDNQSLIGNKLCLVSFAHVFVIVRPLLTKQTRSSRILDEVAL